MPSSPKGLEGFFVVGAPRQQQMATTYFPGLSAGHECSPARIREVHFTSLRYAQYCQDYALQSERSGGLFFGSEWRILESSFIFSAQLPLSVHLARPFGLVSRERPRELFVLLPSTRLR